MKTKMQVIDAIYSAPKKSVEIKFGLALSLGGSRQNVYGKHQKKTDTRAPLSSRKRRIYAMRL